jgi:outer membrane protein assembly factor BamA
MQKFKFKPACCFVWVIFFELIIQNPVKASLFGERAFRDSVLMVEKDTSINDLDIIDVYNLVFRPHKCNIKEPKLTIGLGPFFTIVPSFGYSMSSGYLFSLTSRTTFYTHLNRHKMSTVMVNVSYSLKNQYWATINSNIFPEKPGLNLSGDWRAYKFPTYTFGLGTHSVSKAQPIDYVYLRLYQKAKKKIVTDFYAGIGYMLDYHSSIRDRDDSTQTIDFAKYGLTKNSMSSGFSVDFLFDSRTNLNNPEKGFYCNVAYRYNLIFLGSDQNWQSLLVDVRKYCRLPDNSRNVLAFWSYNYITMRGHPPYLDLPCTGGDDFNNTGRGYVQGRYRGKNFVYGESEYRFTLIRNGLLGGVVFINAESASEWPSNRFNTMAIGYGPGLRIKFNKRSNINVAIDYGFGEGGSRGFIFSLGEIF